MNATATCPFKFALVCLCALLATGSMYSSASGFTGLAANQPAPELPVLPASIFGVEMNPIAPEGGLSQIEQTSAVWTRGVEVFWADVEPQAGQYDWAALNDAATELQAALNAGLTPLVLVHSAPDWAQTPTGRRCGPIDPTHYNDFADFVTRVITDTASPLNDLELNYWSIWNEPDIAPSQLSTDTWRIGCWGDADDPYFGGEAYGQMLETVYPRLKAANPDAFVIAGELLLDCDPQVISPCSSARFLEGVLNVTSSFDGISFHAYDYYEGALGQFGNPNWDSSWNSGGPSVGVKAEYIRGLLHAAGLDDKPILNTENALLLCNGCELSADFETTKGYYVTQANASAIARDISANIWFDATGTWNRGNGLLEQDTLVHLAAYDYFNFASQKLPGAELVSEITSYPGVYGYEFRNASCAGAVECHVWVLWALQSTPASITLPVTPLQMYGADGTQGTATRSLNLTTQPVFLEMPAQLPRATLPIIYYDKFDGISLVNGDLEAGLTFWNTKADILPVNLVTGHPINPVTGVFDLSIPQGSRSVILGDPSYACSLNGLPFGDNVYAGITQDIVVPSQSIVYLRFDYIIYSQDASISDEYDRFEVYIDGALRYADGNQVNQSLNCSKWWRVPSPENPGPNGETTGWATGIIDLSLYQGRTVSLSFRNYSRYDGWFNTYTYIDNIEVVTEP